MTYQIAMNATKVKMLVLPVDGVMLLVVIDDNNTCPSIGSKTMFGLIADELNYINVIDKI